MYRRPAGCFDPKGCDIRLADHKGTLVSAALKEAE
jgi:hypothetical protein